MKKFLINTLSVLAVFSVVYFGNRFVQGQLGSQARSQLPIEIHQLEAGLQRAKLEDKLVLADYSAVWCPSCRKLDKNVFSNTTVSETVNAHFTFVKVEHGSELGDIFAKKHSLSGFPRVIVLTPEGEKLTELPLTFEPESYNTNLIKVISAFSEN
jgi:uncharacterized protein YyaL (SSP411 family)